MYYLDLSKENLVVNGEIEQWVQICKIEGLEMFREWYWISNFGRIKSDRKILKQNNNGIGYLRIALSTFDGRRNMLIHRLVAFAFVDGYSENKNQANHINEIKLDNRADNLNWMSAKENTNHGNRNKKISEKLKNGVTSKAVIGTNIETGETIEFVSTHEAGRQGYNQGNVSACCRGKLKKYKGYTWKYKEKDDVE